MEHFLALIKVIEHFLKTKEKPKIKLIVFLLNFFKKNPHTMKSTTNTACACAVRYQSAFSWTNTVENLEKNRGISIWKTKISSKKQPKYLIY